MAAWFVMAKRWYRSEGSPPFAVENRSLVVDTSNVAITGSLTGGDVEDAVRCSSESMSPSAITPATPTTAPAPAPAVPSPLHVGAVDSKVVVVIGGAGTRTGTVDAASRSLPGFSLRLLKLCEHLLELWRMHKVDAQSR